MDNFLIRNIKEKEYNFLGNYLRDILSLEEDELKTYKKYTTDFGVKNNDICLIAEVNNKVIGICISRLVNNIYAPSIIIAVKEEYRNNKVGSKLMHEMMLLLLEKGYQKASIEAKTDCLNEASDHFLRNYSFQILYRNKTHYYLENNFYLFFFDAIREYDIDSTRRNPYEYQERSRDLNNRVIYNETAIFKAIAVLLDKGLIYEKDLKLVMPAPKYRGNGNAIIDNKNIQKELIRLNIEKTKEIIDIAKNDKNLMVFNYDDIIHIRNEKNREIIADHSTDLEKTKEIIDKVKKEIIIKNETLEYLDYFQKNNKVDDNTLKERSGISRQVLSKIRLDQTTPSKKTLMQLSIGLGINKNEASKLLETAGYAFSRSNDLDVIIVACLEKKINSISFVNSVLLDYGFDEKELFNDHMDFDPRKKGKK